MAAAIILVPEMLSGPDRAQSKPAGRVAGETPLKTYTIDLNRPPASQVLVDGVDARPPPPEEPAIVAAPAGSEPAAALQVKPEQITPASGPAPSTAPPAPTVTAPSESPPVVEPPTRSAPTPARQALASTPSDPTSGSWAVQVGSFSKQATAERLAKELRAEGHEAFVMPVRSGASTLYRVRVGPMKDRSSAEAVLGAVKAKAPGAAVVSHP